MYRQTNGKSQAAELQSKKQTHPGRTYDSQFCQRDAFPERPWRREARGREALGHEPRPQHNGARWWPRGSHRLTGRHQTGMRSSTRMRPACCATPIPAPRHSANLLKRRVSTPLKVVFALALNSENKKYISLLTKFTG